jgi:Zn-dependent membrane protease YugP
MYKAANIYKAPKHVLEAYLNNPALHKKLSSRGGLNSALKRRPSNSNQQLELNLKTSRKPEDQYVTPEEASAFFKKWREEQSKEAAVQLHKQANLPYLAENQIYGDLQRKRQAASSGYADHRIWDIQHSPENAELIKYLQNRLKNPKEQKQQRVSGTLAGGFLGGTLGMLPGIFANKRKAMLLGLLLGGAGGAGLAYTGLNKTHKYVDALTDEELKKQIVETIKKDSKQLEAGKDFNKAMTLVAGAAGPAALSQLGALGATGLTGALPAELNDAQFKDLLENIHIKNKSKLKFNKDYPGNFEAHFDPNNFSVNTSKKLWKPGIVAHELGHANIHGDPGLAGFLQREAYSPTLKMNKVTGGIPASLATYYLTKDDTDPTVGALKGLAAGAVANAGVLVPEFEASRRGIGALLRSKNLTGGQKLLNSLSLAPAFLTYLASTAGAQAGVGGLNAYWNSKSKKNKSLSKEAKSIELLQLIEAKKKSDVRDYANKNHIIQKLTHANPEHFKIDSRLNRKYVGLTHIPTGFKIHAPIKVLPSSLLNKPS